MSAFAGIGQDARYAMRVLAKSPGFTAVAVLSLAIGIGANTAIFGATRFALLDPLPVANPDELRFVYWTTPQDLRVSQYNSSGGSTRAGVTSRSNVSFPIYRALQESPIPGVSVFAFNFLQQVTVSREGRPAVAGGGLMVSGNYFPVLQPGLTFGRGLTERDDDPSVPGTVVLSHGFWQQAFDADASALGSTITINGAPFLVVGITKPGYDGLSRGGRITPLTDVTIPLSHQPLVWRPEPISFFTSNDRLWIRAMARVSRGADERAVSAALTDRLRRAASDTGLITGDSMSLVAAELLPAARGVDSVSNRAERPLLILSAVAGVVLLIACLNLAGLMLARGVSRQRELVLRRALGAGRGMLIRQLLVESVLIGLAGAAASVLVLLATSPVVTSMLRMGLGLSGAAVPVDWRTFAATALVSAVSILAFGLIPAVRLTGKETTAHLRHRTLGSGSGPFTLGRLLLALQIAITLPLIVAAALLLRTVHQLGRVDLGFEAKGLLMFQINPAQLHPPSEAPEDRAVRRQRIADFARRLTERLETVPGVESITFVENALVSGWTSNNWVMIDGVRQSMYMNGVGPRFFETMRIPIVAGRALTEADGPGAPSVAVINETAAGRYFAGTSPLGRRFRMGQRDIEVVGVAGDSKYATLRADTVPTFYDPFVQRVAESPMRIVARVAGPIAGIESGLRAGVAAVSPALPITEMRTQVEQIDLAMGQERLVRDLLGVFACFALVLACVGLYGVTAYSVARRTSEVGIRVALGARRVQVLWLILRQVLALSLTGLAIGVPIALAVSPAVGSLLYGLGPRDLATILTAAGVLLTVALGAGWLPARQAARVDPVRALRSE